jgi:competence protein ComEC
MGVWQRKLVFDLHGYALVAIAAAWLVGIWFASWLVQDTSILAMQYIPIFNFSIPFNVAFAGTGIFGLLVVVFYQDRPMRFAMLLALCACLGAWRYSLAWPNNDPYSITAFIGSSSLDVRGSVIDEPLVEVRTRLMLVDASAVSTDGGNTWQDVDGQIEVRTLDTALEDPYGPNYGDTVELQGKLQRPSPLQSMCIEDAAETSGYPGIFTSMLFPRVSVTGHGGNPMLAFLYHLRAMLATIIEQALPQPAAALLIAIVLGLSTPALVPLKCAFSFAGTIHLIVPSGFKVTILAGLADSSTRIFYGGQDAHLLPSEKLRDWRSWLATSFVILSIVVYTILSGSGPAAIRAGIMGILMVLAPRLGRAYNVYPALAVAAILMSYVDPFVLWDVGFQLSFLGTLGIVGFTPCGLYLLRSLTCLPFGHVGAEITAVTLAAQIATWPIVAITFQQVSFISPLANLLTVPLLGVLVMLGILICATGVFFAPLAWLCGWVAWPMLWYTYTMVLWCAQPWAYEPLPNGLDPWIVWAYYLLLALLVIMWYRRWPALATDSSTHAGSETASPLARGYSRRTWRLIQLGMAILIIMGTGINRLMTQPNGLLTVTFLSVGPAGQPPQGEAILVRTPEGKTMLIDGGMDATALSLALSSQLPSWQRSLDIVLLTCPRQDHLAGLQDIVASYTIGEVIDAGMLHPNTTYARWRQTISERNLPYTQVAQGETIALGATTELQVLWPTSPLHAGSDEVRDNGLILQLRAPGLRLLLLGASAQSNYALAGLADSVDDNVLQSDVVQIVGEAGKPLSQALVDVLQRVHPSLLVITPAELSSAQRKAHLSSSIVLPGVIAAIRTVQTAALVGTSFQITSKIEFTISRTASNW